MLGTRIVTALVLLIGLFAILAYGGVHGWHVFLSVLLFAAFWEWGRLGLMSNSKALLVATLGVLVFLPLLWMHTVHFVFPLMACSALFWTLLAPLCLGKVSIQSIESKWLYIPLGVLLGCSAGLALALAYTQGLVFLVSVLAICWVADSFAYFFGRLIGKRKLAPRISPGKSWEGAIAGAFTVLALSVWVVDQATVWPVLKSTWQYQVSQRFAMPVFVFWILVLCAFSVVGDLFESLLKRKSGLKDSSHLLPGHGGVLDRIDAQLPVLPLALLLSGTVHL